LATAYAFKLIDLKYKIEGRNNSRCLIIIIIMSY